MGRLNEDNNFLYLAASLLILLLASPLANSLPEGFAYWILKAIITVTIIVCYLSLNFGKRWRVFTGALVLFMISSSILREYGNLGSATLLDLVIMLVFFVTVAYSAARRVLLRGAVDFNKIVGAFTIYLLLGLIWSTLYLFVLEVSPTAFNGMEHVNWADNFSTATYFSYVTLTTLGYGDISPAEPLSRVLVFLEAMAGTFYMAVVIASLIGSHVSKRNTNN
ncbi:MAG: two pore domain potassium channel family protein [Proteobacteria bacterium]|nr:two pore domain potassium channel family protein [Pseudomonadota bacterium]